MSRVKKAEIIYEPQIGDPTEVTNKDPAMHYAWGRKNDDMEMNRMVQRGYVAAKGNEKIWHNPLDAASDVEGSPKIRGDRILMCCPKELVVGRRKARMARYQPANKDAKALARKLSTGGALVTNEDSEETTKRESIKE